MLIYDQSNLNSHDINIFLCNEKKTPSHSHDFLELAYVAEGKAVHVLNDVESVISKGDYFILDYNSQHSYYSVNGCEFAVINCLFKPEFIDKALAKCRNFNEVVNNYMIKHSMYATNISPANYIFHDENGKVSGILTDMLDEFKGKNVGYYEIIRCKLIEIIIMTMRKNAADMDSISEDELCAMMIKYAEKHITDKNILNSISERLNFSAAYLSRKFKSDSGMTFSAYIQKMRIEQSCRLLANTDKKITEIAYLSGYSDMKFFNSLFKKHLGITPHEFRKEIKKT